MRRYALPLLLFSAIGAVVVIAVLANRESERKAEPKNGATAAEPAKTTRRTGALQPRTTKTSLNENQAISELERILGRKDLSNAHVARHKVAEQMDEILQNDTLRRRLIDLIREHGTDSDDKQRREIMLPFLRIVADPEVTQMIRDEYYQTEDLDERLLLLEAMAHTIHDPETATTWAVDQALNSEKKTYRDRAYTSIQQFSKSPTLLYKTARAILEGTTRNPQANEMLYELAVLGGGVPEAASYLRRRLQNPRAEEVAIVSRNMDAWGTEKDAAYLEQLATEFPGLSMELREYAENIRKALRQRAKMSDEAMEAANERAARERERREKEKKAKEG